jgi:hypothetical protein
MKPPVQIQIPTPLAMMLKTFGANPEDIASSLELVLNSGAAEKIVNAVTILERIEQKLDLLLGEKNGGISGS